MTAEIKRIIVPTDASDAAHRAAEKALFIARHLGVEVIALYVIDTSLLARFPAPDEVLSVNWQKLMQKEALAALDKIEKAAEKAGVKLTRKVVEGIPDEEIIAAARKNDLIVMGSKGMTALDRILLGSVSEKVVHHAPCPVMVVRA
jgi:nucleotide-binding universal stress UspA family protein